MLTEPQRQLGFQLSLGFRCRPLLNPSSAAILHGVPHAPEAGVVRALPWLYFLALHFLGGPVQAISSHKSLFWEGIW